MGNVPGGKLLAMRLKVKRGRTYMFRVKFTRIPEGYNVEVPTLPGCITWGRTLPKAQEMALDAIRCYVESLLKEGRRVPTDEPPAKKSTEILLPVAVSA